MRLPWYRYALMKFGKLVIGILFVGAGVALLAGKVGSLPPGTWPWIFKYWPLILVSIGAALLANALKNVVIGVIAVAIVLASLAFGWFWISRHGEAAKTEHRASIDLKKPAVRAVTLQARVLGGSMTLSADSSAHGELLVRVHGVSDAELAAHRWSLSKESGVFDWPARSGITEPGLVGAVIRVDAPPQTPTRVRSDAYFSSAHVDLSGVRPAQCDLGAVGSSVTIRVGAVRPPRIRVHGWLSNVSIHLPADCTTRVETLSALTMRSLPKDFVEHASTSGRGKATYWSVEGRGAPVSISIEGPMMRVQIVRDLPKAS
ncbi:MAG: LiaF transmembrane domain-containing protein [Candidatus Eiseniibacteriota bacterium]